MTFTMTYTLIFIKKNEKVFHENIKTRIASKIILLKLALHFSKKMLVDFSHYVQAYINRVSYVLNGLQKQLNSFNQSCCSGVSVTSTFPDYVLALHSSKKMLVEQLSSSYHLLADAIINLTLAK